MNHTPHPARHPAIAALLVLLAPGLLADAARGATAVGRIAGEFAVSPSGAATYTIPIQVAAGMNDMKPEVALGYSSHAGDGLAGMGWNLSGFSEIRRCPLTRALDGRVQGVRFSTQDRFCLDGQPLVLVSGVYGKSGAEYRTEIHHHERIFSQGQQGTGPAWFEVRYPNGLVYRYGNDADSRIEAPGTSEVRTWALNEVEDRFQQRIGFTYTEDSSNGEYRPAEIRWTYGPGETMQQARYRLAFGYGERPAEDIRRGYLWGSPWRTSRRLTTIDYEFNYEGSFQRVHRYTLRYATAPAGATGRSQLAGITQCGPSDCLPETSVDWDDGVAGWDSAHFLLSQPVSGSLFGDYDGNGTSDIFGNYNGYWAVWPADAASGASGAPLVLPAAYSATGGGIVLDVNGDGYADLLARASETSRWYAYLSPGPGGTVFESRDTGVNSLGNGETEAMDIDGDGLDDLVYLRNGTAWLRRNLGGAFGAELPAGIGGARAPYVAVQGTAGWLGSADFDGDGREDLLVARSTDTAGRLVWEAYLSNGSGFDSTPIATPGPTAAPNDIIVLDMNGDGLTDVLRRDETGWIVYISRGTAGGGNPGLVAATCADPILPGNGELSYAVEYEGDGRADLLVSYGDGWRVYRSDGECFSRTQRFVDLAGPSRNSVWRVAAVDRDGDGNLEVLFGTKVGGWLGLRHARTARHDGSVVYRADLVRQLADGLGNVHELSYRPLTGWEGYGIRDGSTPPASRLRSGSPLAVLSQWAATIAGATRFSVSLAYANLREDQLGRGLLGFEYTTATDSRSGLVTEVTYRQDFPYVGRQRLVTVWNGTNKVSHHQQTWAVSTTTAPDPALDVHFVHLAGDLAESYEVDRDSSFHGRLVQSTQRSLSWNHNHGAITEEQTTVSATQEAGASYRTTRTVTLDESLRSAAGCLGFPQRIDVTRDISGNQAETRTVQYGYSSSTCRTVTETVGPAGDPTRQLRTSFSYDASGRIASITRSDGAGQLAPRQTRFSYASGGFRPIAEAQVISGEADLVTTRDWDDGLGLEVSRSIPSGTITWMYDDFGRLRTEARPTGSTQVTYSLCGPCYAPRARYSIRETRYDGYWTETQHDSVGRVVGRGFVLPDNRASRQKIEYDELGRIARESVPYRDDAASQFWTSYRYDLLGRVKSIDRPVSESVPSGAVTTYTYTGLNTLMRDPQQRSTRMVHDAEGRMRAVIPPLGSSTAYTYAPFGQLSSIIDASWNVALFSYDERGLLVESSHPDAGERRYGYNAFGELVSQSDGRNPPASVSLQYDQLGRLTRRVEPEGTTTWTYVSTASAARGQLQQVVAPTDASATGFRESYTYDARGRVSRTTTVIDGSSYLTDFSYGSENKLSSMTYPTTIGWRPKFVFGYSYGHLTSIEQDAGTRTPVYALLAMDALGRETTARFGNAAIEERNVYDRASGRLTAIRSGPGSNSATLQNYVYEWDTVGNLAMRRDLAQSPQVEERFSYDSLDRLTQATLNGSPSLSVTYGPDGNIVNKSDVGNYSYGQGGSQPHAVTAIAGGPRGTMSFGYDANGNMINRNGAAIVWTSYNLPRQINAGADYARFTYGPSRARVRQEVKTGGVTKTIHYVGPHFEVEMQGSQRRYRTNVFAHGRAVYSQLETTPNGLEAYYVLHDHLGSVDRLARAVGSGSETHRLSFDAWGKRRNVNWSADPADQRYADNHWTERGYTGHEHLDNVRLVHMTGRLQDPLLGRMLSPDPVLGSLMNPQALNPYGYVANNPMAYFDPSGFFLSKLRKALKRAVRHVGSFGRRIIRRWGRQITAAVAAYFTAGAVSSWAYAAQTGATAAPGFLTGGGISAAGTLSASAYSSAMIGGVAGGAVAGVIATGDLKGALIGGVTGGSMAAIGLQYGGGYTAGRVLAEATVGGVSAELQGGSFSDGFVTSGAFSSLTWASLEMRETMIRQSQRDPRNASGVSEGFRGDGFKLGGCRAPCKWSPLGGAQGQAGNFFGMDYAPGSILDRLVETYAGPHDFLNSPFFYNNAGNNIGRWTGFEVINVANVVAATPFALASAVPGFAYHAMD